MNESALTRAGGVTAWLIHHAARRAPACLSVRLEEEWMADLADRRSPASRLRFAIGCCWASRVITHEHLVTTATFAVATGEGAKSLIAYAHDHVGPFSRRSLVVGLVVCLHAAVFYALMAGLSNTLTKVNEPPLQNHAIPQIHPRELPLPPPLSQSHLNRFKLDLPPFHDDIVPPVEDSRDVIQTLGPQDTVYTTPRNEPPVPPQVAREVEGGPGLGFPNPDDYYPDLARRREEHGSATVRVCVDASGRLTTDPTTVESTGSPRLDDGALKLARAGSGHYRPTTEDGRPVASCYPLRIRFQLKN